MEETILELYCSKYVPLMKSLSEREVFAIAKACQEVVSQDPVFMIHNEVFKLHPIPGRKFTGLQVMALMISALWVLSNGDPSLKNQYPWLERVDAGADSYSKIGLHGHEDVAEG